METNSSSLREYQFGKCSLLERCVDYDFPYFRCYIRETIAFFRDFTEYVQLVGAQNPKVLQDFIREVNQKCAGGIRFEEVLLAVESQGVGDIMKCMTEGIRDAVKGTDFEGLFEGIKKDMDRVGDRIKACKDESNKLDAAK